MKGPAERLATLADPGAVHTAWSFDVTLDDLVPVALNGVRITVKNGNGEEAVWWLGLNVLHLADFTTADPQSGPTPLTVSFTDETTYPAGVVDPESEGYTWKWDFGYGGGGGCFSRGWRATSTDRNPTHTFNNIRDYTIKLTVTGPEGKDTEEKTDYITVE